MELVFQPRADGFRVCEMRGGIEHMVASVVTKAPVPTLCSATNPNGATEYEPLPRGECTIHSAIGPLTVEELEAILSGIG